LKAKKGIEEILKDKFDSFEPQVPDSIWANVESSIGSGASSGGILSTIAGKIAAVVVGGSIIAGSVYIINNQVTNKDKSEAQIEASLLPEASTKTSSDLINSDIYPPLTTESKVVLVDTTEGWEDTSEPVVLRIKTLTKKDKDAKKEDYGSYADMHMTQSTRTVITLQDLENLTPTTEQPRDENAATEDITLVVEKPEEDGKLFATINASVVGGNAPLEVDFTQHSSEGKIKWVFGDFTDDSFKESPTHTYEEPGRYVVSLIIEANGKIIQDEKVIEVSESLADENDEPLPSSEINYKPNVFTPNGDGNNDYMLVGTENMEQFHFILMGRTGSDIIFETNDPSFKWDGKLKNGTTIANGTYVYIIIAKGKDGKLYDVPGQLSVKL